jgi:glycosyltransferase involved in cell wall biosynthesis
MPTSVNLRRALVVSHLCADPMNRGKLRALGGLGVAVSVAVPERWVPSGSDAAQRTSWEGDGELSIVPVEVRGDLRQPATLRWHRKTLRRLVTDFRPDIIHVDEEAWTPAAELATRLGRRLGVPCVIAPVEPLAPGLSLAQRLRRKQTYAGVRGIVAGNALALALAARHRPDAPAVVIPRVGVSPPVLAQRAPHADLAIGFLGRLVPQRGLDLIFRSCVGLVGRWTLTVVGTGPSQEELEGLAERLGIAARVTWLGALPRGAIREVWPRLDCVVIPSRTTPRWVETEGRAAVDAMAHGLPVVVTRSGVLPHLVGEAGKVIPEEDVPALTAALQDLRDDAPARERLGAAARRRIMEEYSDVAVARKTLDFWRRVASATG